MSDGYGWNFADRSQNEKSTEYHYWNGWKKLHKLELGDIFYFETVDNKSFFYCNNQVYETKLKLYEFENVTRGTHFFRASKSVVLNADRIDYIRPAISGRFEATLENGEKVMVSRQFVPELKKILGV